MKNIVDKIDDCVAIKTVLVSVSDKSGLEEFVPKLVQVCPQIKILSTGGTYNRIHEILGSSSQNSLLRVSEYTGQPETQGGLVKTLDFKIYLGLLTETYNEYHANDLKRTHSVPIDMVVVNLYPFAKTIADKKVTVEKARANIDIGGPTMIRASAKNYLRVASVVNPDDYHEIIQKLEQGKGTLPLATRFDLAKKAFLHTATYDAYIAEYLSGCDTAIVQKSYTFTV